MEQTAWREEQKDDSCKGHVGLTAFTADKTVFAGDKAASSLNSADLPELTISSNMAHGSANPEHRSVVVVDKSEHQTHIIQLNDGCLEDVLTVPDATGKGPKMTPEGKFHIIGKELHPTWYPPSSIGGGPVGPGPHNPLGSAKIRTDAFGGTILLHGTNRPDQIGTNASHGCIRHPNADILRIYPLVQKGDAVYITRHFDGLKLDPDDLRPR